MQVRLPRNTAATLSQFVICGILRQPLLARQPLAAERLAQRVQQVVIDQFDELRALGIGLWQSFDAAAAVRMPSGGQPPFVARDAGRCPAFPDAVRAART